MKKHIVECDGCGSWVNLEYNGEHYLAPDNWVLLVNDKTSSATELMLCPKCVQKITGVKTSNKNKK